MINPESVMIVTPTYDRRIDCDQAGTLFLLGKMNLAGTVLYLPGNSIIPFARDRVTEAFIYNSQFEWMVSLDSDITFTVDDFKILMDYEPYKRDATIGPAATMIGDHALLVAGAYPRKVDPFMPALLGLGFARIHRTVFERVDPKCQRYIWNGLPRPHFYPCGPTQAIPPLWRSEDHGFIDLAKSVGIMPLIETRTRLGHVGPKVYKWTDGVDWPGKSR